MAYILDLADFSHDSGMNLLIDHHNPPISDADFGHALKTADGDDLPISDADPAHLNTTGGLDLGRLNALGDLVSTGVMLVGVGLGLRPVVEPRPEPNKAQELLTSCPSIMAGGRAAASPSLRPLDQAARGYRAQFLQSL